MRRLHLYSHFGTPTRFSSVSLMQLDLFRVFDGIHEVYAGVTRTPEMPPGYMAYRESVAACAAAPTGMNPGGHRHSPYGRAPVPRQFAVPPTDTAVRGDFPIGGSAESYSRAVVAAVQARRHQSLPPHTYGRDDVAKARRGTTVVGGEHPRPRHQPPPQHPYHPSGPTARPMVMFREGGRGQGYHVGGHAVGASPQYQPQPGQWKAHGGGAVSMPSVTSRQTEAQDHRRTMARW